MRTLSDRYVLEAAIGTGSMGTVFRACDKATGDTVAVKCLKSMDAGDILRFDREFEIVSELAHPAIVACWGAAKTETGEAYFVMDWLEGESLRDRLRRSELTLEETLALAQRVLSGLAFAHAKGFVHRDVKPANIFMEGGLPSRAKLLDFGIARHVAAGETLTATGQFMGTPGYISPEQIRGERVDQRADVYSVGCLLFRCLSGHAAFEDDNLLEMMVRVTRDRAPRLAEVRNDLPEALSNLVDRMLEREPVDRPADASEALRELECLPCPHSEAEGLATRAPRQREAAGAPPAEARERTSPSSPTSMNAAATVGAPAAGARPTRRAKLATALAVLMAAAVPAGFYYRSTLSSGDGVAPASASAPPSDPFGPAEERLGKDARVAWGAIRMGSRSGALRRLAERANSGAASGSERLWLALLSVPGEEAKRNYREAVAREQDLTRFEQAVLQAATPQFAGTADYATANDAMAELASAAGSPELWLVLARLRIQMYDRDGAHAALANVTGEAWATAAALDRLFIDWEFFDVEAAKKGALACLDERTDAVDCVAFLGRRAGLEGDCEAMEKYARRWVAADREDPLAYEMLAVALAARGEQDRAVLAALEQKWARLGDRERPSKKRADLLALDALRGRFDEAKARARAMLAELPADALLLQRLGASFDAILLATETGDMALATEIASGVLERASAATPATATDATYFLLFAAVARAYGKEDPRWKKLETETLARYEAYIATQGKNLRPYQRVMPWVVGYAAAANNDEIAKVAYEAIPRYGPLPPVGARADDIDFVIGNVLTRNGEVARGLPYLRRAARSCMLLENPYAVRARERLGQVLEKQNDLEGAKQAYESVLAVWQTTKPQSRTATKAKEGLARIRASKPPNGG